MKTKPKTKYFKITVNASCKRELDMRIAENESRGFELVGIHEVEKAEHVYQRDEYRGMNVQKGYRAVMQREDKGESQWQMNY